MKILIVEDHADVASLLKRGLEYERFTVDMAEDGQEALEMLRQISYELVILDLMLPKVDGIEVLEKVRSQGNNTPILVLTAVADQDTKVKLLHAGADDYLEKPFLFNELLARVHAIIRRSTQAPKKQVLQVGELLLNPATREVFRGKEKIVLRKKEFMLLEYLMRYPGEVISRTDLLEHVWDFNSDVFSNTIETHIVSLRSKLDKGHKHKLVETVHGVGYKLNITDHGPKK